LFLEIPGSVLCDPDESRYAEIPREMLASRDFVTPTLNGSHYFEKPPLLYWVNAASMAMLGENPYAARLAARLATLGTAVALFVGLTGTLGLTAGLWAALIFLSSTYVFALGRINLTDGLLTFNMTAALLCLREFLIEREGGRRLWRYEIGLGFFAALAMLSKGLVGIVIPGAVAFLWIVITGQWKRLRELLMSPMWIVFALVAAPWFLLVEKANPGFLWFFFVHEHLLRYATSAASRSGPITYFIGIFLVGFLPWTFFFPKSLAFLKPRSYATWRETLRQDPDGLFFALWFFVVLGFFSVSHSKLIPYIFPLFPAASVLLARRFGEGRPYIWKVLMGWAIFYLVLVLAFPSIAKERSTYRLAMEGMKLKPETVVCYRNFSPSFPWALKRPVPVVESRGELASDGVMPPPLFWNEEEFWRHWNSNERVLALVGRGERKNFEVAGMKLAAVIAENRKFAILANFAPVPQKN
jgi:4-amino-4-deoxy-L-arabinose transferase-like glycosyltransferase